MDLMADENDGDTHAQPPLPPLSPVAPVANMLPVADMLPVAGMLPVADSPQPLPPDQHRLPDSGSNIALADPQQLPHVHSQVPIADAQQQAAPEPLQLPPSLPSKPERDHDAVQFTYRGKPENPLSAAYPWLQVRSAVPVWALEAEQYRGLVRSQTPAPPTTGFGAAQPHGLDNAEGLTSRPSLFSTGAPASGFEAARRRGLGVEEPQPLPIPQGENRLPARPDVRRGMAFPDGSDLVGPNYRTSQFSDPRLPISVFEAERRRRLESVRPRPLPLLQGQSLLPARPDVPQGRSGTTTSSLAASITRSMDSIKGALSDSSTTANRSAELKLRSGTSLSGEGGLIPRRSQRLAQKIAQREDARAALPESSFEAPLGIPEDPADVQMQLAGHVDTSEDVLALFSDGSINFSKGGGAGVAFQQNGHWSGKAFALDRLEIDSYEAEAEAIGEAFNTAAEMLAPHHKTVEVFTDHQGLFEAYSGLHEPKEAQKPAFGRVLEAGAQLEGRGVEVRLTWVKGHGVWAGNTMADSLARLGAEASAKELNSDGTRQVHVADDEIARLWASAENASKTRVAAAGPRWARGRLRRIRQVSSAQHRLTKMRSWKTQKDLRRDAKLRQRLVNRWNEREWAA